MSRHSVCKSGTIVMYFGSMFVETSLTEPLCKVSILPTKEKRGHTTHVTIDPIYISGDIILAVYGTSIPLCTYDAALINSKRIQLFDYFGLLRYTCIYN